MERQFPVFTEEFPPPPHKFENATCFRPGPGQTRKRRGCPPPSLAPPLPPTSSRVWNQSPHSESGSHPPDSKPTPTVPSGWVSSGPIPRDDGEGCPPPRRHGFHLTHTSHFPHRPPGASRCSTRSVGRTHIPPPGPRGNRYQRYYLGTVLYGPPSTYNWVLTRSFPFSSAPFSPVPLPAPLPCALGPNGWWSGHIGLSGFSAVGDPRSSGP